MVLAVQAATAPASVEAAHLASPCDVATASASVPEPVEDEEEDDAVAAAQTVAAAPRLPPAPRPGAAAAADPRDFMGEPSYTTYKDVEELYARVDALVPADLVATLRHWVLELLRERPGTERALQASFARLRRETKVTPHKNQLTAVLAQMTAGGEVPHTPWLQALLVKKSSKSQSGVLARSALWVPLHLAFSVCLSLVCRV